MCQPGIFRWCQMVTLPRFRSTFHLASLPRGRRTCDTSWGRQGRDLWGRSRGPPSYSRGQPSQVHMGPWGEPRGVPEWPPLTPFWVNKNTYSVVQRRQVAVDDVVGLPVVTSQCPNLIRQDARRASQASHKAATHICDKQPLAPLLFC